MRHVLTTSILVFGIAGHWPALAEASPTLIGSHGNWSVVMHPPEGDGGMSCELAISNSSGWDFSVWVYQGGNGYVVASADVGLKGQTNIMKGQTGFDQRVEFEIDNWGAWILDGFAFAQNGVISLNGPIDDPSAMSLFLKELGQGQTLWLQKNSDTAQEEVTTGVDLTGSAGVLNGPMSECLSLITPLQSVRG
jgi:hypothetical protein